MRTLPTLIMTVLMGAGAYELSPVLDRVKRNVAVAQLRSIAKYIKLNSVYEGFPPEIQEGAFSSYLRKNMAGNHSHPDLDPWGSPYQADYLDDKIVLHSHGPDKIPNTADDLRESFSVHKLY